MDWDDLRFVLAVARAGSALGASKALGVNQSTVVRRLEKVERDAGAELFDRRQSGYCVTPLGRKMVEVAERIETEMAGLQAFLGAAGRSVSGVVRLTTSERLASAIVGPCVHDFQIAHPDVRIELYADDRRLDLAKGEADIALRASSRPEGAGIVARKLLDVGWTVYCSKEYAAQHGMPATREEIRNHEIIGTDGPLGQLVGSRWIAEAACGRPIRFSSNSLSNLIVSLRSGLGVATLPCLAGDFEPGLVRCRPPPRELDAELWLIVREEVKAVPAVRTFVEFLAGHVHQRRAELSGRPD